MKSILYIAAAAFLFASPAMAQKAASGSVSGAQSYAGNNWSTVNKGGIPGASSVVGSVASTPFKCRDMGGLGVPYFSVAIPVDDTDCGPIVAAMAWDSCKSPMCQTILSQNRYIARGLEAQAAAGQQVVVRGRQTIQGAVSSGQVISRKASYQDRSSSTYSPNLRD